MENTYTITNEIVDLSVEKFEWGRIIPLRATDQTYPTESSSDTIVNRNYSVVSLHTKDVVKNSL